MRMRWADRREVLPVIQREFLILFVSDIFPSTLSTQMLMHNEIAQKKAEFEKGLYTSRWLFFPIQQSK